MTKLRYIVIPGVGERTYDWEERFYHINIPVHAGMLETDDQIAIEALVRRGEYEIVEDEPILAAPVESPEPQPKKSTARKAVEKG